MGVLGASLDPVDGPEVHLPYMGNLLKTHCARIFRAAILASVAPWLFVAVASAQTTDENAVAAANDAFGTKVGNDNVGLYSSDNARGFNPTSAGNIRVEGLYFDQQAHLGRAMIRSTTMRVGLSAQSYPFAAPTGIADISMSMPAEDHTIYSVSGDFSRPTGSNYLYATASGPATEDLGWYVGVIPYAASRAQSGSDVSRWSVGGILRWRPTDTIEAIPFAFIQRGQNDEVGASIYTAGDYVPPKFDRSVFLGQEWADRALDEINYGLLLRTRPFDNWTLRAGLFSSELDRSTNYVVNYRNVQPNGSATLSVLKYPSHLTLSYSGEVRATGVYSVGQFRHTLDLAVRGRDVSRTFGGGTSINFGTHVLGVAAPQPYPRYTYGVRDKDVVKQYTPGVSYALQWANVGEMSLGLQRSYYDRSFGKENAVANSTRSQPWLYNATLAYYVSRDLVAYGSYSRGIEEFGTAPDGTANAGEPLQARVTSQIDAGIRYTIIPGLNLVMAAFEIKKPYYDKDATNLYTVVGDLKHTGVEFSLTGKPTSSLTVVAGAVYIKGRVSGLPVNNGTIGSTEPGLPPYTVRFNVQYRPTWMKGVVGEFQMNSETANYANRTNTFKVPTVTTFGIGARYPFKVGSVRVSARLFVDNVLNAWNWTVDGNSGRFSPSAQRNYQARLSADF